MYFHRLLDQTGYLEGDDLPQEMGTMIQHMRQGGRELGLPAKQPQARKIGPHGLGPSNTSTDYYVITGPPVTKSKFCDCTKPAGY